MTALVDFLMISNVRSFDHLFAYTENIINGLIEKSLITQVIIPQSTLDFGGGLPIMEIEDNIFALNYMYSKESNNSHWQLALEYGTFNSSNQLKLP